MKRFLQSIIGGLTLCGVALVVAPAQADDDKSDKFSATISFGQWDPNAANLNGASLDRLISDPAGGRGNNHELIPEMVTITQGGSVNFIISGQHVLAIYEDPKKTKHDEIDANKTIIEAATDCPQSAGGVIKYADGRVYRGPCFNTNNGTNPLTTITRRDGAEVVKFSKPGTYLVICARRAHFDDGMFGYVRVKQND